MTQTHDRYTPLQPHPTLGDYYAKEEGKRAFVRRMFDDTAVDYDHVERMMALGERIVVSAAGAERAGLAPGMRVLDVAVGTGLVAREEIAIIGDSKLLVGVDPSIGMLSRAVGALGIKGVMGVGEQLPVGDGVFDFLSMGYGVRHLTDLTATFREFGRVLKPGGKLCVLEITRPRVRIAAWMLRTYMRRVVPILTRLTTGHAATQKLWEYYWETIEACIEPGVVMDCMRQAGFEGVRRHGELGIFSEYTARKR